MSNELPNRRYTETIQFQMGPISCQAGLGFYPDGRLYEIFLDASKSGTDLRLQMHEAAILASKALQYGCPAEELRTAMPRTADGKPEGAIGKLLDKIRTDNA